MREQIEMKRISAEIAKNVVETMRAEGARKTERADKAMEDREMKGIAGKQGITTDIAKKRRGDYEG